MSLSPGTKVGPYAIVASLGAGGMGEVYRARDPKLNRDVAIKVLPALFAGDADRLVRFRREAQSLAALNHPNIAAIYEMSSEANSELIVMELVEGEELSKIIARGPVPLSEAIPIARQIADALEAAHNAGIVHRDLKPANVKVRADGTVKVLDFGLAKAIDGGASGGTLMSNAPTITSPAMTAMGMIMGTAAYMAPEQARGQTVDKRADIWAFGIVLFEMLTGRSVFNGETVTDTVACVLQKDPEWSALPPSTPQPLRRLLKRALTKDRKLRLHDIADARLELDEALAPPPETPVVPSAVRPRGAMVPILVAVAVTGIASWLLFGTRGGSTSAVRDVGLPPEAPITFTKASPWGEGWPALVVSPNADFVVYVADRGDHTELWRRSLVDDDARPVPDTEDAYMLALNRDGDRIAFIAGRSLKVTSLNARDAPVREIAQVARPTGLMWTADNRLLVPEIAGTIETFDLSGGRSQSRGGCFNPEPASAAALICGRGASLDLLILATAERKALVETASDAMMLSPELVAFSMWDGTMMIAPWSSTELRAGQARSTSFRIRTEGLTGARQASLSSDGTLVFVPGPHAALGRLVRRTGSGDAVQIPIDVGFVGQFDVNPDGRRLAVTSRIVSGMELAVYDMVTGQKTVWFTQPNLQEPRWSPDGSRLIVWSGGDDGSPEPGNWVGTPSSGLPPTRVTGPVFIPSHWYDANHLLGSVSVTSFSSNARIDLKGTLAKVQSSADARATLRAVLTKRRHLVAFMSDDDIVVETFPNVLRRVTVGRGLDPLWIDDQTLMYRNGTTWYRASIGPDGSLQDVPKGWFADDRFVDTNVRSHALTPGGEVIYQQSASKSTFGYLRVIPKWDSQEAKR